MIRIGHGYDIHRFDEQITNSGITLAGIKIPFEHALIAHSDGDVAIHALCDALLGALALGDIGKFFPDTDPEYKNCDSKKLLSITYSKILESNYKLLNLDITIVAEKPKISSYILSMREALSLVLKEDINKISIKATTNERLDAIGELKGIAAFAVASLGNSLINKDISA